MATQDRHLTTEHLSAFLDGALSAQERVMCEIHLNTCEQCQHTLAELRQTVALLHALPQPALPRSFILSAEMLTANSPVREAEEPRILPFPATRRTRPGFAYTTMRFASAIAAVIGLILLTASLFSVMPHSMNAASGTSAGGASSSSAALPSTAPNNTKNASNAGGTGVANNQHATTVTPSVQPRATQVPHITSPDHNAPVPVLPFVLPDLTTPGGEALLGIALLVLGIAGLLVLRWRRNRLARAPN